MWFVAFVVVVVDWLVYCCFLVVFLLFLFVFVVVVVLFVFMLMFVANSTLR